METIKLLNEAVRFFLELCILIILGYWGFKTGNSTFTKILLGIGSPLLFAVIWGIFLAPKSATRLQEPWLLIAGNHPVWYNCLGTLQHWKSIFSDSFCCYLYSQ